MTYKKEVEAVYKKFREVLSLKTSKKYKEAITLLSNLLPSIKDNGLKTETIAFRADIYEEMGDKDAAKKGWLHALSLIKAENYAKYVLEMQMGVIHEKENNKEEALSWYLKALSTGIKSNISGGWGLSKFVSLKGEDKLTKEERELCEKAVLTSWKVLSSPGEPDLKNLLQTAQFLIKVESTPKNK